MADKASNFIKKGSALMKEGKYKDAIMEFEVSLNFYKNPNTYIFISSCYMKLNDYDSLYKTILQGQEIFKDDDKFLLPLQKYYEKKGYLLENLQVHIKLCQKSLKDEPAKIDKFLYDCLQAQLDWINSEQFQTINSQEKCERELSSVSSIIINSLATKNIQEETEELIVFLYVELLIQISKNSSFEKGIKELERIVGLFTKFSGGVFLDESIYKLLQNLYSRNMMKERDTLIYKVFSKFKGSLLALHYQLVYFPVSYQHIKIQLSSFTNQIYQAVFVTYYPTIELGKLKKEFTGFYKRNEDSPEIPFPALTPEILNQIQEEFKERGEIFLMFAQKCFKISDIPLTLTENMKVIENNFESYLEKYDLLSIAQDNNRVELKDGAIYSNPLFELYLFLNYSVSKKRGKQFLFENLKKTIMNLDQKQENVAYLNELYQFNGLQTIDNQDELISIKNQIKSMLAIQKDSLDNLKLYYLYTLKLNKFYKIYDSSIPLPQIVDQFLKFQPDNIFFKSELIWIQFALAQEKQQFYKEKVKELQELHISAKLSNERPLASIILKRITILQILFDSSVSQDTLLNQLEQAKELDPTDYQIYVCSAIILSSQQKKEESLVQLKTAFIYHQKDIILNKMIFFQLNQIDSKEAVDFLFRIYPAFKSVFWINRILGVYFSNSGDYKRATQFCQRALEIFQFDKGRKYQLHYEKISQFESPLQVVLPHMIDSKDFLYYDDYIVWQDEVFEKEAINLSSQSLDPKYRIHVKLCISLAQTDKMQGKTCSSMSAIEEAEVVYLQMQGDPKPQVHLTGELSEKAKEVSNCLLIFESVFASSLSFQADEIIKKYDLNVDSDNLLDALVIQFETAQISYYLSNSHTAYERIRIFLVFCYQILQNLHTKQGSEQLQQKIFGLYSQLSGFILELGADYVRSQWKKYTYSSAQVIIDKLLQIQPPQNRSVLVNVAFSEFWILSGILKRDTNLIINSIDYLKQIFNQVNINYEEQIIKQIDKSILTNLTTKELDVFKYSLKTIILSFLYLDRLEPTHPSAYTNALALASAGIIFFNQDIDFYNYYGKLSKEKHNENTFYFLKQGIIHKEEKIKVGAFVKSARIQKNCLALDSLAFIYLGKQRYEESTNMFLKSIEIDPTNPTAYIGLFIIQYGMALAFEEVVNSKNDDERGTYQSLQNQMVEKCGSYLHYVKQMEISASSEVFDGLLEYMNYHNSRSHISYLFSNDLFDRAPHLKDTQIGTLHKLMVLRQSITIEKKREILEDIKNKIHPDNFDKLFLDKIKGLDANFLQLVQNRVREDLSQIIQSVNLSKDHNDITFQMAVRDFESVIKNIKLSMALSLYIGEAKNGVLFFKKQIEEITNKLSDERLQSLCNKASQYYDLLGIYISITELEYNMIQQESIKEIEVVLKRLANLKYLSQNVERITVWPFRSDFILQVENTAEFKYLLGVHFYKTKNYQQSKKSLFSAVLLDPTSKKYRGHYNEYLLTQERLPILNLFSAEHNNISQSSNPVQITNAIFEQSLIIQLNNPNLTLKQKISQITKTALYLDKPYLYYLLVHFSFEEPTNFSPTRLYKLLVLLKIKVLNEKVDPNKVFRKKGIKLYLEILEAALHFKSSDQTLQSQLQQCVQFADKEVQAEKELTKYRQVIQAYYSDLSSPSFFAFVSKLLEEDKVTAYILIFNVARKLMRENKTKGMIELLQFLSQSIYSAIESGYISEKVQKSNKGKIIANIIQHIDGYQYLLALQEDYREDSSYDKPDIQEMITNWATHVIFI